MKLGSRHYWTVFAIFLGITLVRAWMATHLDGSVPEFLREAGRQRVAERVYELSLDNRPLTGPVSPPPTTSTLVGPVYIKAGPDGNLFAADEGDNDVIKEFSPNGEMINDYSQFGKKNIESVTDLAIEADNLWVADLLGSAIHRLDRANNTWTTFHLDFEPYRLEIGCEGKLLVMRIGEPKMFATVSPEGKTVATFGLLLKDQDHHALALSGFIRRSGDHIIYTGKWLGALASFSGARLEFLMEPIALPGTPVIMETDGTRWVHHGPLPASLDIAADQEGFYILTRRRVGLAVRSIIDLYQTNDGFYYKSLLLPTGDRWSSLALSDEYIYVAGLRTIARWPAAFLSADGREIRDSTGRSIVTLKLNEELTRRKK